MSQVVTAGLLRRCARLLAENGDPAQFVGRTCLRIRRDLQRVVALRAPAEPVGIRVDGWAGREPQSAVLAKILPEGVAVAEFLCDPPEARPYPQEAAAVAGAVPERRLEYATVRHCARLALTQLGLPPVAVPSGPDRAPIWPADIAGSMTHCTGYRGAALAPVTLLDSIGIDAEPHEPLPDGLLRLIARPDELPGLAALRSARPDVHWDRLTFSAKESVYKAWYPLVRRWIGFEDASLRFDPVAETFTATVHQAGESVAVGPLSVLTGRWRIVRALLLTAVVVTGQDRRCTGDA